MSSTHTRGSSISTVEKAMAYTECVWTTAWISSRLLYRSKWSAFSEEGFLSPSTVFPSISMITISFGSMYLYKIAEGVMATLPSGRRTLTFPAESRMSWMSTRARVVSKTSWRYSEISILSPFLITISYLPSKAEGHGIAVSAAPAHSVFQRNVVLCE